MRNWFFRLAGIWPVFSALCLGSVYASETDTTSVLFIGNSYTHMNNMPKIFEKICVAKGRKVYVEMNTKAGASFSEHVTRTEMYNAIRSRKWDFVVLQGYSREFTFSLDYIDTATLPYLKQIVDTIREYSPCAGIHLYLTWGYKEGYSERPETDTYEKMTELIYQGYQHVSDSLNLPINPVGLVWKNVRASFPEINLYDEDKAHPNKNGSYLSACTHFASIFKESPEGVFTNTLGIKEAQDIQKTTADLVLNRLSDFKLDINYYSIDFQTIKGVKSAVTCTHSYEQIKGFKWEFGDGVVSTERTVQHRYVKPGSYTVKLTIEEDCGLKVLKKKIVIADASKPRNKTASGKKKH